VWRQTTLRWSVVDNGNSQNNCRCASGFIRNDYMSKWLYYYLRIVVSRSSSTDPKIRNFIKQFSEFTLHFFRAGLSRVTILWFSQTTESYHRQYCTQRIKVSHKVRTDIRESRGFRFPNSTHQTTVFFTAMIAHCEGELKPKEIRCRVCVLYTYQWHRVG